MCRWPFNALLILLSAAPLLGGCPAAGDDDDSAVPVDDDDDATPPPDPLADVIGLFNLTRSVDGDRQDAAWVDFSGAFGSFAALDSRTLSPTAYLATFQLGAQVGNWRWDLGAFPIPELGQSELLDVLAYLPYTPAEQVWWDGGSRLGVGNYLSQRADFETVMAYVVDDPLSPGNDGWTPGASVRWQADGGADVLDWVSEPVVTLPEAATLVLPDPSVRTEAPAALPLMVSWTPRSDGAVVTLTIIRDTTAVWISNEADDGDAVIPPEALAAFGAGEVEIVLGRMLDHALPHPQGDVIVRARDEQRATVDLLPDVVFEPPFAQTGETRTVAVSWYTGTFDATTTLDLGGGVTVDNLALAPADPHRATATLTIDADAPLGGRTASLTTGPTTAEAFGAFSVLDLPPQGTCADAGTPLEPGTYTSTTGGLGNDFASEYACMDWSLNASDAVYGVELLAGQTLTAVLSVAGPGDGALILMADCDGASALQCSDWGFEGEDESVVFTATEDGTYYLAVDGYLWDGTAASRSWPFQLLVSVDSQPVDPAWIQTGTTAQLVIQGAQPWTPGLTGADVDLGEGLGVGAAAIDADPTQLFVQATASPSATVGPRDVTVESTTFPEALWVTELPSFDSCAQAQDAVGPGTYEGLAVRTTDVIPWIDCLGWDSPGGEVILPLQLTAGDLVSATVQSDEDTQLYVVSACDPTACDLDAAQDIGEAGDPETITAWAAPSTGTWYLVIDLFSGPLDPTRPWAYSLDLAID